VAIIFALAFVTSVSCNLTADESIETGNFNNDLDMDSNCICNDTEALYHQFVRTIIDKNGPEGKKEFLKNFRPKPVCGSDLKVYANKCELQCTRMKTPGSDLHKVKPKFCRVALKNNNKRKDHLKSPQNDASEMQSLKQEMPEKQDSRSNHQALDHISPPHVCLCQRHYFPVCASNGITYGNPCTFKCAQKYIDSSLTIVTNEPCNVTGSAA